MKATDVLKKEHAAVKKLFGEFRKAGGRAAKKRGQLAEKIGHELQIHTQIEEEIFYPAMQQAAGHLVDEARREHEEVKELVAEVEEMEPTGEEFLERMTELRQAVEEHVKEEESELFARARALGDAELHRLGQVLASRKEELMGGPARRPVRRSRKAA